MNRMDKFMNGGYICSEHKVGYRVVCPTCLSIFNERERARKRALRKMKRKRQSHTR